MSDYHDTGRGTRMSFSAGKLGLMTEVDVVAILGLLDAITKFVVKVMRCSLLKRKMEMLCFALM